MKERIATIAVLTLLGLLAAVRIVDTYDEFNATFDEGYHVAAGLQAYQEGRFDTGAEQPPLVRWALGLLPGWAGVEYRAVGHRAATAPDMIPELARGVLEEQGEYWETLRLARVGNLLFLPLLLFYTFRWSADLFGRRAGWAACAIVTLSPNILAHASLATVDFGFNACMVAASYHLWRWLREPSLGQALVLGCTAGLAVAAKYSALVFLPAVLLGFLISQHGRTLFHPGQWQRVTFRQAAGTLIPAACLAVLVVWAAYLFETRPLRDPGRRPYDTLERWLPEASSLKTAAYWAAESLPLPLQDFAEGVRLVGSHADEGHSAFLLGQVGFGGFWYFFPVVLGVKTTLPFIALIGLAGFVSVRQRLFDSDALGPAASALGILLVAMAAPLNIGLRHILPVYVLLAIWASGCFGERAWNKSRKLTTIGLVLLCWHGVESVRAHPDYLPYFNQIGRGREHDILGDSNLDWGQDLHRLARYVEENGIENLSLSYFGTTSPQAVGLRDFRRFGPEDRPKGWVAVSVTNFQGIYEPRPAWLDRYRPHARVGKSIWLYFIE